MKRSVARDPQLLFLGPLDISAPFFHSKLADITMNEPIISLYSYISIT